MMRWRLHAWAILRSRTEFFLETPEPNLAVGMRQLNGIYTQAFNRRHDRSGAIFQGRYKGILVEREHYFLPVARTVVLAPLQEREVRRIADLRWSSYRSTALLAPVPSWLDVETTLALFDARSRLRAARRYRDFIAEGRNAEPPWSEVRNQIYLGSEAFRERMLQVVTGRGRSRVAQRAGREVWRPEMRAIVRAVAEVFGTTEREIETSRGGDARMTTAFLGRHDAAQTLSEIGRTLSLGDAAVSRLASAAAARLRDDARYARQIARIRPDVMKRAGR
jgi:hypothetical protein